MHKVNTSYRQFGVQNKELVDKFNLTDSRSIYHEILGLIRDFTNAKEMHVEKILDFHVFVKDIALVQEFMHWGKLTGLVMSRKCANLALISAVNGRYFKEV